MPETILSVEDKARLLFRRQFLLSRGLLPALSHWTHISLAGGLHIYAHPDLEVHKKEHSGRTLVLLGCIFDPFEPHQGNAEILTELAENAETSESLFDALKKRAGQFVLICLEGGEIMVLHDALGLREVYYCTSQNLIICGSQPNVVSEFSNPPLGISQDEGTRRYHDHDLKRLRAGRFWIGDETYYAEIKHLLPNHYLDVTALAAKRYWPREKLKSIGLEEAVERSCAFLRGVLLAASKRHDLMMAVTAGTDSRTLLAASREITGKIYYFINRHESLTDKHPDIYVPSAMFQKIGVPFHIHDLDGEVDAEFREIFLRNTFLATDKILPAIYGVYFKRHGHKLNVLGVGEIGRTFFGDAPINIDGYYLARSLKAKDSEYAVSQCQRWLADALPAARAHGVNVMTLLLWEQLLGNWGAVGNSESDIAIEEFDPFDSHGLYETLLGVDKAYARYGESVLFKKMINQMWPELLEFPINPPHGRSGYARFFLKKLGIYGPLKALLYKLDRWRFENRKR